jgi:hypothetical protein
VVAIHLEVVAVFIDGQGSHAGASSNAAKQSQRIASRALVRETLPFFATESNDPVRTDSHLDDPSSSHDAQLMSGE